MTSWNGNIFRVTDHLCGEFTCWYRNKIAGISQTTFSHAFSWMEMFIMAYMVYIMIYVNSNLGYYNHFVYHEKRGDGFWKCPFFFFFFQNLLEQRREYSTLKPSRILILVEMIYEMILPSLMYYLLYLGYIRMYICKYGIIFIGTKLQRNQC